MSKKIEIIPKPDSISWEDISTVLKQAHKKHVEDGVNMPFAQLPPEEIMQKIDGRGVMFVALSGEQLVGTGAVLILEKKMWCGEGKYAYSCFDAVLPEFAGNGIYKSIAEKQEEYALSNGVNRIFMDTHDKNHRMIDISKKSGYECVNYKKRDDHNSVLLVKWLQKKPYSHFQCYKNFMRRKLGVLYSNEKSNTITSKIKKAGLRIRLLLFQLI